jgi:hypothetical protein
MYVYFLYNLYQHIKPVEKVFLSLALYEVYLFNAIAL